MENNVVCKRPCDPKSRDSIMDIAVELYLSSLFDDEDDETNNKIGDV